MIIINWKSHIIVGIILSIIFTVIAIKLKIFNVGWKILIFAIPIIIVYSILPDIDHPISKITGWFFGIGVLMLVIGYLATISNIVAKITPGNLLFFGIALVTITFIAAFWLPHRGIVHTIWFALLTPLLLIPVFGFNLENLTIFLFAAVGYWSHLIADGIPFKTSAKPKGGKF